jgi:hypothetical protein
MGLLFSLLAPSFPFSGMTSKDGVCCFFTIFSSFIVSFNGFIDAFLLDNFTFSAILPPQNIKGNDDEDWSFISYFTSLADEEGLLTAFCLEDESTNVFPDMSKSALIGLELNPTQEEESVDMIVITNENGLY